MTAPTASAPRPSRAAATCATAGAPHPRTGSASRRASRLSPGALSAPLALAAVLALSLATLLPAGPALAAGGSVGVGAGVSKSVEGPRSGDAGSASVGAAVGVAEAESAPAPGRAPVGVEVAYLGWHGVEFVAVWMSEDGSPDASRGREELASGWAPHGSGVVPPAPAAPEGYWADAWYASVPAPGEAASRVDPASLSVEGDLVLYALFRPAAEFSLALHGNGGVMEDPGTGAVSGEAVVGVTAGAPYGELPAPKRAGWSFAGWWTRDGSGGEWGRRVSPGDPADAGEPDLWARWDLRLDVTVPVSVGFAVDASTGGVETPEAGRYALRSRTAAPVTVEEVSLSSSEADLARLFSPIAGDTVSSWDEALRETELWLRAGDSAGTGGRPADGDPAGVVVPFAGERSEPGGEGVWESARRLEGDCLAAFTVPAFDRDAAGSDGNWSGELPCSSLGLKLGMEVPADKLRVRAEADGPQRITTMTLTVSAQG